VNVRIDTRTGHASEQVVRRRDRERARGAPRLGAREPAADVGHRDRLERLGHGATATATARGRGRYELQLLVGKRGVPGETIKKRKKKARASEKKK
jgi:hypothetical protein